MKADTHYDKDCTSTPMLDRCASRMVISHGVEIGWILENFEIRSALLHELYKYGKTVYISEMVRAGGWYKYGNKIGILVKNQYGNPSGTFYYVECLLTYLQKHGTKSNEQEQCLVRIEFDS